MAGKHYADDEVNNKKKSKKIRYEYVDDDEIENDELEENEEQYSARFINDIQDESNESDEDDEDEEINDTKKSARERMMDEHRKQRVIAAIVIVLIIILLFFVFGKKSDKKTTAAPKAQTTSGMIKSLEGFPVLGQVKLDRYNVQAYILRTMEDEALNAGVCYLDNGASLNNEGNFCIAGHNTDDVFGKLKEYKIGDTFTIIDPAMERSTYKVTNIIEVEPTDMTCLMQVEDKIQVSLITCTNGTTKRLVVIGELVEDASDNASVNATK